jgi:hypothetical protein
MIASRDGLVDRSAENSDGSVSKVEAPFLLAAEASGTCQEATYAPQQKSTRYSITPSAISSSRGWHSQTQRPWGKDAPLGRDI